MDGYRRAVAATVTVWYGWYGDVWTWGRRTDRQGISRTVGDVVILASDGDGGGRGGCDGFGTVTVAIMRAMAAILIQSIGMTLQG